MHYYWTIKHWQGAYGLFTVLKLPRSWVSGSARMWDFYLASVELGFLHGSKLCLPSCCYRTGTRMCR